MSDASSVTLRSVDPPTTIASSPGAGPSRLPFSAAATSTDSSNPWLAGSEDASGKVSRKKNEVLVGKDSRAVDKAQHALQKQRKKTADQREREKDDASKERLKVARKAIADVEDQLTPLKIAYENEKKRGDEITETRRRIDELKAKADEAERR